MKKRRKKMRVVCAAMLVVALASLGLAGSAQAKLVEPFTKFQYCPWHNAEVARCLYSVTTSGEVVLGSKKVPIVNPVVLQGAYGEPEENDEQILEILRCHQRCNALESGASLFRWPGRDRQLQRNQRTLSCESL